MKLLITGFLFYLTLFPLVCKAIPVTYLMYGEVTTLDLSGLPNDDRVMIGHITWETEPERNFHNAGFDYWSDRIIDYHFYAAGVEIYSLERLVGRGGNRTRYFNNGVRFDDEFPQARSYIDGFSYYDVVYWNFTFSKTIEESQPDLPVDKLIDSRFHFYGGDVNPSFGGVIEKLVRVGPVKVPEPSPLTLLAIGGIMILVNKRRLDRLSILKNKFVVLPKYA